MILKVSRLTVKDYFHLTGRVSLFLLALIIISSCNKKNLDEIIVPDDPPMVNDSFEKGIFIVNEGNYNWGNASVSFIESGDSVIHNDIFRTANNRELGDVAQNMIVFNGLGFIVVNNSNCVEVVSLKDFKSVKTITGFNSPRSIEIIDSTKAYVTNMVRDITIIDLKTLSVKKTLSFPDWTESMIRYNDYMFVTSVGNFALPNSKRKAKIRILRTSDDKVVDSITTGKEPLSIVIDRKNKIWVLCTGGYDHIEPATLVRIDPDLKMVEKSFTFAQPDDSPSRLCMNTGRDTLYFLNKGVFKMAVSDIDLPSQPLIPGEGHLFYGLAIHPVTGNVYVSDAVDYVQSGWVYQFNQNTGTQINAYRVGRIPATFCFSGINK